MHSFFQPSILHKCPASCSSYPTAVEVSYQANRGANEISPQFTELSNMGIVVFATSYQLMAGQKSINH